LSEQQRTAWIQHWLAAGLQTMETLLAERKTPGKFCYGDTPTVADICLVTQVTPAQLFKTDLAPYPRVMEIHARCMEIPAFANSHPRKQPDAE
jgi:glutathione S-transferase